MILEGRTISKGRAEGRVLKLEGALSFLGGVDASTAPLLKEAGCGVLVAGSAVFGKADRGAAIRAIRDAR